MTLPQKAETIKNNENNILRQKNEVKSAHLFSCCVGRQSIKQVLFVLFQYERILGCGGGGDRLLTELNIWVQIQRETNFILTKFSP